MMNEPIVVNIKPPRTPLHLPHFPAISERATKIITVTAAIVICISMVIFVVFSAITNSASFKKSHHIGTSADTPAPSAGVSPSNAALPGGGTAVGSGSSSSPDSPVVTITATPSSVSTGGKSHLKWSVTNNPTSCTASDDWSGTKDPSGETDTQSLTKAQSYLFTLTCKNKIGTGFATVSVGVISQGGTGAIATRPAVTLAANPNSVYTGDKSTLIWTTTNGPSSCTASGDWSGNKTVTGSENTAVLSAAKSYTYTLTCSNSAGTGFATTTVSAKTPPANIPVVTIDSNALGSVAPGSSVTITWTVSNNPTSCVAGDDWTGTKAASGTQKVGPLNSIKTYSFKLTCTTAAGTSFDSATVMVIPAAPVVTLSASPANLTTGGSATLTWSATNSPASCTASGDWTGTKAASGTQSTGALNTVKTYSYSLTCKNAGGTGYANNIAVKVSNAPIPSVNLSINPISATTGGSATLTWSATNSPASCTASGDWTGTKAASGTQSTGALNTAKTYTYVLSCSNSGGSASATTSITVSNSTPVASKPAVTMSVSPTSVGTGSAATISWSATNNPSSCTASGSWSGSKSASGSTSTGAIGAAGSYSYTMTCSNSAGSGAASASLTAIATPGINISVSPASVTTGAGATLSWSVTNSPSSCSAGGSWSGTKAASGSQAVSQPAAGNYTYSLSCSNSGGTATNSTSMNVSTPVSVYCSGLTPCYGQADMAAHATAGSCWGYNLTWVIDITSYAPHHKGGTGAGSLATAGSTCNMDIHSILTGASSIPGYKDSGGKTTHGHNSSTTTNSSSSALKSYFKGYYDSSKP
jgi:hypothetical protein